VWVKIEVYYWQGIPNTGDSAEVMVEQVVEVRGAEPV